MARIDGRESAPRGVWSAPSEWQWPPPAIWHPSFLTPPLCSVGLRTAVLGPFPTAPIPQSAPPILLGAPSASASRPRSTACRPRSAVLLASSSRTSFAPCSDTPRTPPLVLRPSALHRHPPPTTSEPTAVVLSRWLGYHHSRPSLGDSGRRPRRTAPAGKPRAADRRPAGKGHAQHPQTDADGPRGGDDGPRRAERSEHQLPPRTKRDGRADSKRTKREAEDDDSKHLLGEAKIQGISHRGRGVRGGTIYLGAGTHTAIKIITAHVPLTFRHYRISMYLHPYPSSPSIPPSPPLSRNILTHGSRCVIIRVSLKH